jgi:ketosteroid isomerase-like protein
MSATPRYDQFQAVINHWRRKDAEAVLAAMTDDVVSHVAATAKPPVVGKTVVAPYVGVIEFRGDKICGWRDYVDYITIEKQRAGEAPPAHVTELAGRKAAG